jgi:hypothetical protein
MESRSSYDRKGETGGTHPKSQIDWRLERLIRRLPRRMQRPVRWLLRPSARWVRIPAAILLMVGSVLSILPVFGIWMLPLGIVLLAQDVPFLRRMNDWILSWIERHRPQWLQEEDH